MASQHLRDVDAAALEDGAAAPSSVTQRGQPVEQFPDERTKMSYEIAAAVRRLDRELPEEPLGEIITLLPIAFEPEHEDRGATVLFWVDDFMETNDDETVIFIKPRTKQFLDALNVPYHVVDPRPSVSVAPSEDSLVVSEPPR
jgi:hypothetical protein